VTRECFRRADLGVLGEAVGMTTPEPQPRDIALEQETPEQAADLEAQSEPEDSSDEAVGGAHPS
jgi:hypothetical protein